MKLPKLFAIVIAALLLAGSLVPAAAAQAPEANTEQDKAADRVEPLAQPDGGGIDYADGPDGYGYYYIDSLEPSGPSYGWIDATGGTNLALDDTTEANITLPFSFTYYGTSSTALRVGNNGAVLFGVTTGDVADANSCPLSSSATANIFGPWWDDWATTGDVYWQMFGTEPNRYVVIEWYNMAHYSAGGTDYATFELILTEGSTDIIFQYADTDVTGTAYDNGLSGTVGIHGATAANTLQYRSCNTNHLSAGLAIRYLYRLAPILSTSVKAAPAQALIGSEFSYNIHLANTGTVNAADASLSDVLPDGVAYIAGSVSCTSGTCAYAPATDEITWTGVVTAGASVDIAFAVDMDDLPCGTLIQNTAVISDTTLPWALNRQATTQAVYALPYVNEGFEGTPFPPSGWTEVIVYDAGTDPDWTRETGGTLPTVSPHSGVAMAKFNSYNATATSSARLYTPAIDMTSVTAPALTFWMAHYNSTTNDRIQVQVSTDGGSNWTNVGAEIPRHDATCGTACWKLHTQSLVAYAGQPSVMVGFLGISAYGYNIFIDDVTIAEPWSPCPYVSLGPDQSALTCPGTTANYALPVLNANDAADTIDLSATSVWSTNVTPVSLSLGPGATGPATASVYVPWAQQVNDSDTALIDAAAQTSGLTDQAALKTTVPLGSSWTDRANAPHNLRMSSTVYYNGKLYTIGGYDGTARGYVDIYDIANNSWSSGTALGTGTYGIDCAEIGGKIYCAGGQTTTTALNIYDIANNSWSTGAVVPAARYYYAGVALDGKYYVIGGYNASASVNTIYAYDPGTNTWNTSLPTMTDTRRYPSAGVIGGKIYVVGGYSTTYLSSMEVFDPAGPSWSAGTAMVMPWLNAADAVIANRFLVLSGGGALSTSAQTNQAWMYDQVLNTWSALPNLPRALYAAEGDSDGTNFWMVGGYSGSSYIGNTTRLDRCAACTAVSGADFVVSPSAPRPGRAATFTGSVAAGSPAITYEWDFGDGTTGAGQVVTHTYAQGSYTVVMTVTNCDGASISVATHNVQVMPGPLAVVDPLSLSGTTCPDGQATQELSICNEGDAPLTWSLDESLTVLNGGQGGVDSLSGSFVVFDPSVGGNTQFENGVPGTFCFRAESFTNDWEYRYLVWLKFPSDWTIANAYLVGTPWCASGSTWSGFVWGWENAPYELVIDHRAYNQTTDHCVATYCVDATPGQTWGDANVSWYWSGDGYAGAPHHPCSNDVYTPGSMAAAPCDEAINPRAVVPWLDTTAIPWLNEDPHAGTVQVGECTTVTVTYDATGLTAGDYTAWLTINTNDNLNPVLNLPVTLTVAGPPTNAAFTATPDEDVLIGQAVSFNGSVDALMPVDYAWDFGDGATGTGQSPTHAYAAEGTFTVIMTATECGASDVATGTITVLPCYQVLREDFEGDFPPAGWTVDNHGIPRGWLRNDQVPSGRTNYAGGQGFCADADVDRYGSGSTMNTELRTMSLDLSVVHTATLSYVASYNWLGGLEYADTDISLDGGTTWTNLVHWNTDHQPNGPGEPVAVDLTPYAGYPNVMLRYYYYSPAWNYYFEVDQVDVFGCFTPGVYPDIDVTPSSLTQTLYQHQTANQEVYIHNLGAAPLGWTADVGCGTPVSWLTVSPASGAVPGGGVVTPTATFDSDSLAVGTYTADICIESNDPDEPTVIVAATLIVTGAPDIAVSPSSLHAEQCADTQTTQQLQICNNGTADLEWTLVEVPFARMPSQTIAPTSGLAAQTVPGPANASIDPAIVPPAPRAPEDILVNQPPNQSNGIFVDAACSLCPTGMQSVAENFILDQNTLLTNIVFWSGYYSSDVAIDPDHIRVLIHQDAGGLPGAVVYDESEVAYARVQTGVILFGVHEWMHTLTLATPPILPPGVYWVEIYNNTGASSVDFFWEVGNQDPTYGLYDSAFATETPGVTWYTNGGNNMSMQIIGMPVLVDIPWLSEALSSGTLLPGECATVDVTFDSTGLTAGDYLGNLLVESNDPDTPELTIPVTLTVLAPPDLVGWTYTADDLVVTFDATATGFEPQYAWDFGDGATSNLEDPVHTYAAGGCYTVTLVVSNDCGQDELAQQVCVCDPVTGAAFTFTPPDPVVGETVSFFGSVGGGDQPYTYTWDFGDGGTATGQNVSHAFAAAGDYLVTLTVDNPCGTSVAQHTVTVAEVNGFLDGYVFAQAGGVPIEGALVTAAPGSYNDTTDATGYYTIALPAGTYDATASKLPYDPQTVTGLVIQTNVVTHQDFYLTLQGQWLPGPTMCFDLTRIDAKFYPANGKIYILGGRTGTSTLGNIYEFDPTTGTCVDTGDVMPNPISNYTANLLNNGGPNDVLCTFGGRDSAGGQTLDVQCYDPIAGGNAVVVAQLPSAWTGIVPGAQVVVDNQAYIFGGFNPNGPVYMTGRTERFDPLTNTFTQIGDLSVPRSYIMATVVEGKIYAFGGDDYDGASLIALNIAEVMADPGGAGTWDDAAVADMPVPGDEGRAWGFDYHSGYPYAGQIVIATMAQWSGASNEVILYDIGTDSYDTGFDDLINARRNHGGTFVPLCTGDPSDGLPGMWVFGGYLTGDNPPYAPAEYYPMPCAGPVADIELPITSFDMSFCPDLSAPFTFQICNEGTGPLDWSLVESPDAPWLSEDLTSGTVAPGECQDVVATFDSHGVTPGNYTTDLLIDSNDPIDPQMTLPVGFTVFAPISGQDFSFSPAEPIVDQTIYFSGTVAAGEGPVSYAWDLGDGSTATGQYVQHAYAAAGTYTVIMTATGYCGDAVVQHTVVVGTGCDEPLDADFSFDPVSPFVGDTVTFNATIGSGTAPFTFDWTFGDGGTATGQSVTHVFATAGTFPVHLTVTNACGQAVMDHDVVVQEIPEEHIFIYLPVVFKHYPPAR